jgi:hypothetical protein
MKKSLLTTAICLFFAISTFAYSGGNGSEQNPYLISSKADMEQLATNVNGGQTYSGTYFKLTRDLTEASDTLTTIVGNSSSNYFSGTFDGNGHKIAVNRRGIFGRIQNATIRNLEVCGKITTPSYSSYYVGGICAYAISSNIMNCRNSAEIESSSTVDYSYTFYVGGICGFASSNNTIINCCNTNTVSGTINSSNTYIPSSYSGGICGCIGTDNQISNCYNTGNITARSLSNGVIKAQSYAGGICGGATNASGKIQNCFVANCQINNGTDATRAKIGRIGVDGIYSNCYADDMSTQLNGDLISSTNANSKNGKDETLANLQSQSWLTANLQWDFDNIWHIIEGEQFPVSQYAGYQDLSISMEITDITYGSQVALNATSNNSVAPIEYTISDNTIAELTDNLLTAKKAGTVTITASQPLGNGFFAGSTSVNLTVQKKELTVTANPDTITYGDTPPAYTCLYTGFVNDETESVLTQLPSLNCNATALSNAGDYSIIPSNAEAQNYTFVYQPGTLTIQKRNLQVTPDNASRAYGYADPTFSFSYEGFVNGNTAANIGTKPTATTTATATSNVGEYTISCSGGNATNYDFTYGTGTLTVTKAPLTASADNADRNYRADNPAFSITYAGFKNSENQSVLSVLPQIDCTATAASVAGNYPITVSGGEAANYEINCVNGTLTVNKILVTVVAQPATSIYGDTPPAAYTCQYSGFVNDETESVLTQLPSLNCTATALSNAGEYDIVPLNAEAQNYTFVYQPGTLTIQKRNLQVTPDNASRAYGYADPTFSFSYEGFVNGNTAANIETKPTATTTATATSNVGEYTISCSGGNATNYDFTYGTGTLTVTKAPLTASADNADRNYRSDNPAFSITYAGFRNSENQSVLSALPQVDCTATTASVAGNYPITVSGGEAANYEINCVNGTLTVNKVPLTIVAQPATSVYGDTPPAAYTCQYSGFVNDETESVLTQLPSLNCTATALSNAGEYDIVPSNAEAQNYTFVYQPGTLTIQKRNLQVTLDNASRVYGYADPTFSFSYEGFVNGNTAANIETKPTATTTATATSNVGEYTISCSGGNATNYSFTYGTSILTVTKAPLTATVNISRSYGTDNPALPITYTGFRNSENQSALTVQPQVICTATSASNAGDYPVIVSGGEAVNYDINCVNGTLTVTKVLLTIVAQSATSIYGDTPPVYTCQYFGFVNGETESVLTQLPSLTCSATALHNVSQYSIVPSNAEALNYTFSYQSGTLTIQKRNLQVTPDNVSRTYGSANPAFTLSYSGFVNGNTASNIVTKPTVITTATSYSNTGEYLISCSGGSANNYSFTYNTGTLTVTKAPLTITANNAVRNGGEDNPAFTLSYSGFRNNETESVLDVLPTISCDAGKDSPAGFYDIILSGGEDNNYEYQLVNGRLEVTASNAIGEVSVSKISIYPNPVKHDLYIQSDYPVEKVEIYNQSGLCVLADGVFTGKIDVSGLSAGVYYVRVYANGVLENRKIVVGK